MNYSKNILSSCFIKYEVNAGNSTFKNYPCKFYKAKSPPKWRCGKDTSKKIESILHQVLDSISIYLLIPQKCQWLP